jgi:hypothetical protein
MSLGHLIKDSKYQSMQLEIFLWTMKIHRNFDNYNKLMKLTIQNDLSSQGQQDWLVKGCAFPFTVQIWTQKFLPARAGAHLLSLWLFIGCTTCFEDIAEELILQRGSFPWCSLGAPLSGCKEVHTIIYHMIKLSRKRHQQKESLRSTLRCRVELTTFH